MALLQISEPDVRSSTAVADTDVVNRPLAVGIDLGTTHSLVAVLRQNASQMDGTSQALLPRAYALADAEGKVLLPSAVAFGADGEVRVGAAALRPGANGITSVKRLMGRSWEDVKTAYRADSLMPAEGDQTQGLLVHTAAGKKSPVEISAQLLCALKQRAVLALGLDAQTPLAAVITVPAYFDEGQRQATKDAAQLAGLQVLRLLNEPTAAAIAYGLDNAAEGIYVIFDLGGGTFDISILRLKQGVFEVVATGGDTALGGDDIDILLAQELCGTVLPEDRAAVLAEMRRLKESLSLQDEAIWSLSLKSGIKLDGQLQRAALDKLVQTLLDRMQHWIEQTLKDARLDKYSVEQIVMVGGATRMPVVRRMVTDYFDKSPIVDIDPDQVVAHGAAIQAGMLSGYGRNDDDWLLLDVTPLGLGLEIMGGLVETIIPRNSPIPITRMQTFTTYQDGQTGLQLHVLQGERDLVSECRSLARFDLEGIPPMTAGAARIDVSFQVDADGLLTVSAYEQTQGIRAQVAVKPSYGLNDETISQILRTSFSTAEEDKLQRALREQQVELRQLLQSINQALKVDGDLLTAAERLAVDELSQQARAQLILAENLAPDASNTTVQATTSNLHQHQAALSAATENFAADRMNRHIRTALTGKTLDDVVAR